LIGQLAPSARDRFENEPHLVLTRAKTGFPQQ
jgi:hypothetical protein